MFQIIILLLWLTTTESVAEYPVAKPGCQARCGNITIPYPFGIGPNCAFADSFAVTCNNSFNPPKPFINSIDLELFEISVDRRTVQVNNPVIFADCPGRFYRPGVDLRWTPFTFSDTYNSFIATGCNNLALITHNETIISGCMSICNGIPSIPSIPSSDYISSNGTYYISSNGTYCYGINCCQTTIPPSLTYINASISRLDPKDNNQKTDCKHAFLVDYRWFSDKDIYRATDTGYVPAVLDWVYNGTCNENASFCGSNAHCFNYANTLWSSQCYCKTGYEGNPYLPSGCRDIDECSNSTLNTCGKANCLNLDGSYNCSCPVGYLLAIDWLSNGSLPIGGYNCHLPPTVGERLANDSRSRTKVIIACTCSGLGVLLLLICSWLLWQEVNKRKEAKLKEKFFKRNGGLLLHQQLSSHKGTFETTKLFTSKELEKATDNYNANRILGQGGQGTVYKGMLTDGRIVAVKKSKVLHEDKLAEFINEVVILSQINHRNVVKLFGCCLETEVPMLVYEFIPNGTLLHYICDQNEEFPLTWDLRLRIATEIAGALSYLHSAASIAIYHRDIKSTNILLDEKFRAKVSDFGISRSISVDKTHLTTAVQGTIGYLDPEYFQSSQFTEKSDVYSFGVVLVELLTGERPILSGKSDEGGSLIAYFLLRMNENRLFDILDARVVKEGGKEAIWAVATIAKRCLQLNGSSRPTMKEVLVELDGIRMSNGASATGKQSCPDVEYATDDLLTGPWEATFTSTGSFCSTSLYPTSVV